MAVYTYTAINANGLELSGELNAPDVHAATEQLRARGLMPSTLDELSARSEAGGTGGRSKKVKSKAPDAFTAVETIHPAKKGESLAPGAQSHPQPARSADRARLAASPYFSLMTS